MNGSESERNLPQPLSMIEEGKAVFEKLKVNRVGEYKNFKKL